jgi:hypothetical protein
VIEYCDAYKYLGLWLSEHCSMKKAVKELTMSASRALSALYIKYVNAGGFTFDVFKRLYESLVEPVLFYCAGVWNTVEFRELQVLHNKACRLFLGGGKCASNVALRGDLGWSPVHCRGKIEVFRLWLSIERSDENRITNTVHKWGLHTTCNISWESRVAKMARQFGVIDVLNDSSLSINNILSCIRGVMSDTDTARWELDLQAQNKLRTYRLYKTEFECETYCSVPMSRGHRSILFKFRSCNLQLNIETGRYVSKPIHERVCTLCNGVNIEDEQHFLMTCTAYTDLRFYLFKAASTVNASFNMLDTTDKFIFLLKEAKLQNILASILFNMYKRRRALLGTNVS